MSRSLLALVAVLFAGILSNSCGKFTLSPYLADTPNSFLNKKQVRSIESIAYDGSNSFKVAVISDTHNYYDDLADQIDYINDRREEFSFVIIGGDLTNLGLLREFETTKKLLQSLELPYVSAVGNHDLLSNGPAVFSQMFGPTDFSFTFKQTKFVVFNNNNWESSGKVPDLNFVESELVSATETHIVLVGHVSPLDDDRWSTEEVSEMEELVNKYNVKYFLNGHDHNPGESAFGVATRTTIGASNKRKVMELTIDNSGIRHEFISL